MSGLEPYYRNPPPAPLTGGARFLRGFWRIGIVLAVLFGFAGAAISFFIANEEATRDINRIWQRQCIRAKFQHGEKLPRVSYNEKDVDLWDAGCNGPESSIAYNALFTLQAETAPDYYSVLIPKLAIGLLITAAIAVLPLLASLTIGWIAAGFTRF